MRLEHIGITVAAPLAMADWYRDALNLDLVDTRGVDENPASGAFLRCANGGPMLEFFKNPGISPLAQSLGDPIQLHFAFESDDPDADSEILIKKGATFVRECEVHAAGERLLLLLDPWGNTIQLVNRPVVLGTT